MILSATAALLAASSLLGTIDVPADFPAVQAAVDAAQAGDVILIDGGTYAEAVTIDKAVTLVGRAGPVSTISAGVAQAGPAIRLQGPASGVVTLCNLTIAVQGDHAHSAIEGGGFSELRVMHCDIPAPQVAEPAVDVAAPITLIVDSTVVGGAGAPGIATSHDLLAYDCHLTGAPAVDVGGAFHRNGTTLVGGQEASEWIHGLGLTNLSGPLVEGERVVLEYFIENPGANGFFIVGTPAPSVDLGPFQGRAYFDLQSFTVLPVPGVPPALLNLEFQVPAVAASLAGSTVVLQRFDGQFGLMRPTFASFIPK